MKGRLQRKARSREQILRSAARVFRRKGYAMSSVEEVMAGAGLTVGGFYAHFKNKDDLFQHSLMAAACDSDALLQKHLPNIEGWEGLRAFGHAYLSLGHVRELSKGCPLPGLSADLARGSRNARRHYQEIVELRLGKLADRLPPAPERRQQLIALMGLAVGGMSIARGMPDADSAEGILAGARAGFDALIDRFQDTGGAHSPLA
jgi:TetR/AcrR family transcriptional repressor of nem operon